MNRRTRIRTGALDECVSDGGGGRKCPAPRSCLAEGVSGEPGPGKKESVARKPPPPRGNREEDGVLELDPWKRVVKPSEYIGGFGQKNLGKKI